MLDLSKLFIILIRYGGSLCAKNLNICFAQINFIHTQSNKFYSKEKVNKFQFSRLYNIIKPLIFFFISIYTLKYITN